MRGSAIVTAVLAGLALGACDREHRMAIGAPLARGVRAVAPLRTLDGAAFGRATATDVVGGLRVTLDVQGVAPGAHGTRIHAAGRCDAPDFATVGARWNPPGTRHGLPNAPGPQAGDLPDLVAGAGGHGTIGIVVPGATLADLLDADGAAIVVDARAGDPATDPAGGGGGRIACGVFGAR